MRKSKGGLTLGLSGSLLLLFPFFVFFFHSSITASHFPFLSLPPNLSEAPQAGPITLGPDGLPIEPPPDALNPRLDDAISTSELPIPSSLPHGTDNSSLFSSNVPDEIFELLGSDEEGTEFSASPSSPRSLSSSPANPARLADPPSAQALLGVSPVSSPREVHLDIIYSESEDALSVPSDLPNLPPPPPGSVATVGSPLARSPTIQSTFKFVTPQNPHPTALLINNSLLGHARRRPAPPPDAPPPAKVTPSSDTPSLSPSRPRSVSPSLSPSPSPSTSPSSSPSLSAVNRPSRFDGEENRKTDVRMTSLPPVKNPQPGMEGPASPRAPLTQSIGKGSISVAEEAPSSRRSPTNAINLGRPGEGTPPPHLAEIVPAIRARRRGTNSAIPHVVTKETSADLIQVRFFFLIHFFSLLFSGVSTTNR